VVIFWRKLVHSKIINKFNGVYNFFYQQKINELKKREHLGSQVEQHHNKLTNIVINITMLLIRYKK